MYKREIVWGNIANRIFWGFAIKMDYSISDRRTVFVIIAKKERMCQMADVADPTDEKDEINESKKKKIEIEEVIRLCQITK